MKNNTKLKPDFQPKLALKIKEEMIEHHPENQGMTLRKSSIAADFGLKKEIRKLKNENQELKQYKADMDIKYRNLLEVNQSFFSSLNARVNELETELKNTNEELDAERDKNENLETENKKLKLSESKKTKANEKKISDLKTELENSKTLFEKEKYSLLKKIDELKKKTNNQTTNIIPDVSKTCFC